MAKLEVTKTIEVRMLNKRNRQVLSQPPVTLPYGAILTDIVENRDALEFQYLGELYNCKTEVLRAASRSLDDSRRVFANCNPDGANRSGLELVDNVLRSTWPILRSTAMMRFPRPAPRNYGKEILPDPF